MTKVYKMDSQRTHLLKGVKNYSLALKDQQKSYDFIVGRLLRMFSEGAEMSLDPIDVVRA